ncbi:hypothetical protein GPECTOR_69g437 [Gonium pectorale]|uniref:UBA domain-containing protein n=1 Tax=Gonium pectorale TaxID=33097 RepID=A0A150G3E5_GONPE|nr:hypothetical protein GPECTOR_69g437 [Gonium pectorale]|eukprot:KXZ44344.1 hypothetical protein GPECTOR_69g437 [Gonium pectorale]
MAFAAALTEKRGPRVGDAASLWNFTPAPGWTREEVNVLRLCLMKCGVGQWMQILNLGLLPGKMIQQLNGQTQRLLGQQSLAAYTGLRVDVDRIRVDNEARTDATRKAGLIIYDGPALTKEMKAELREEAQRKYGLTAEHLKAVDEQLEELAAAMRSAAAPGCGVAAGAAAAASRGDGAAAAAATAEAAMVTLDPDLGALLAVPIEQLPTDKLVQLLVRLRNRLACLDDRLRARQGLAPRAGPRWAGEGGAAAMLDATTAAYGAAAAAFAQVTAAAAAAVPAAGANGGSLLAEATAARVRSGTGAGTARPPAGPSARKRNSTGGKARGSRQARAQRDADEWSSEQEEEEAGGGSENAGPGVGPYGQRAACGVKRKPSGEAGGADGDASGVTAASADGAAARRGSRAKRAARYDPYIDEYDVGDEAGGIGGGGSGGVTAPAEAVAALTAMGFSQSKARGALRECHFNVELAVEWLFANCV